MIEHVVFQYVCYFQRLPEPGLEIHLYKSSVRLEVIGGNIVSVHQMKELTGLVSHHSHGDFRSYRVDIGPHQLDQLGVLVIEGETVVEQALICRDEEQPLVPTWIIFRRMPLQEHVLVELGHDDNWDAELDVDKC